MPTVRALIRKYVHAADPFEVDSDSIRQLIRGIHKGEKTVVGTSYVFLTPAYTQERVLGAVHMRRY